MKKPLPQPLDTALKTHYQTKSLSAQQSDHLLALQLEGGVQAQKVPAPMSSGEQGINGSNGIIRRIARFLLPNQGAGGVGNYRYAFPVAAVLLFAFVMAFVFLPHQSSLPQRIMDEIAYNHQQKMPVEVASSSLTDIRNYLDKLTFPLISPSSLDKPGWQLLGGRYCSINGKIAAQLKVKNLADNNVYTLYQVAIDGELEDVVQGENTTKMIGGVGVSIWEEKGLLLGLASSP